MFLIRLMEQVACLFTGAFPANKTRHNRKPASKERSGLLRLLKKCYRNRCLQVDVNNQRDCYEGRKVSHPLQFLSYLMTQRDGSYAT